MIHKDFMYHLRLTFRMNPLPLPDSGFIIRLPYVGYTMRGGWLEVLRAALLTFSYFLPERLWPFISLRFATPI